MCLNFVFAESSAALSSSLLRPRQQREPQSPRGAESEQSLFSPLAARLFRQFLLKSKAEFAVAFLLLSGISMRPCLFLLPLWMLLWPLGQRPKRKRVPAGPSGRAVQFLWVPLRLLDCLQLLFMQRPQVQIPFPPLPKPKAFQDSIHSPLLLLRARGPKRRQPNIQPVSSPQRQVLPHGDSSRPGLVSLRHAGEPPARNSAQGPRKALALRPRRSASCLISGDRAVQRLAAQEARRILRQHSGPA